MRPLLAQYDHLQLVRAKEPFARRKDGRPGPAPKPGKGHGGQIRREADDAVARQRAIRPPQFVDPSLILKVHMHGLAMEGDWEQLGLTLLNTDDDNNIVLFSSTDELSDFRNRLDAYEGPTPAGQKNPSYSGFINRIGSISTLEPRDRLGIRIKEAGFTEVSDLQDGQEYILDVELWEFGTQAARRRKAEEIIAFIEEQGGELYDHYSGPSITMIRVKASGQSIRPIFSVPEVAFIDLPPEPDIEANQIVQFALDDVPPVAPLDPDLPIIAVLDTGVNDHPFLADAIVAREAFPSELGEADIAGHGTAVAGVAALGDLRSQLDGTSLQRVARIISAKVVTDERKFFDRRTLPSQMRQTIQSLNASHGCRIFVISLGDTKANFEQGRVGPWATTLDELARELNVLIFVSAGNRPPRGGTSVEQGVTQYPGYLLEVANRVCEPAGGANIVTVGALAHANGIGPQHEFDAHIQPITERDEPAPFTRTGPGAGGMTKPDFVDYGGTMVFDAVARRLQTAPHLATAGLITTNHDFLRQLLTSKSGTSFAAPMLANRAAQLVRRFPGASANLIKALLANSATVPEASTRRLLALDARDHSRVHGIGLVDTLRAAYSDDHRVVYFVEDSLELDHFAVYRVPIPIEFQTGGKRTIRVSLAYDPPVKRTRAEYIGTRMNFRLIRGCPVDHVFEYFRSRVGEGTDPPEMAGKYDCDLVPKKNARDKNTIQSASISFSADTTQYGGEYHLVVRCVGGWAMDQEIRQNFALVVELEHHAQVQLYARLRPRLRT